MKLEKLNFKESTVTYEEMLNIRGGRAPGDTVTKSTGCSSSGGGWTDCTDGDEADDSSTAPIDSSPASPISTNS
jgi:hypothetical protein